VGAVFFDPVAAVSVRCGVVVVWAGWLSGLSRMARGAIRESCGRGERI